MNYPMRVKGSREEHTEQMQKGHEDEGVRAPVMNISDQTTEQNFVLKVKNGLLGLVRKRLVDELEQNSRSQKQENQNNRHAAQPPGEGPSKRVFRNASRPKVKNQGVEKPAVSFPCLFCS
jgi:UDP-N-acetylglucosamine 2-epimerase